MVDTIIQPIASPGTIPLVAHITGSVVRVFRGSEKIAEMMTCEATELGEVVSQRFMSTVRRVSEPTAREPGLVWVMTLLPPGTAIRHAYAWLTCVKFALSDGFALDKFRADTGCELRPSTCATATVVAGHLPEDRAFLAAFVPWVNQHMWLTQEDRL